MFTGAKLKNIIAAVKPNGALKDAEKLPAKNEAEALVLAAWPKVLPLL
jgi:hypothetical protein